MRAYAILDGGGVKGAALVGCLVAAAERRITFAGYGGTSAGSLVATLSAVGYTPEELRAVLVDEMQFSDFVADAIQDLEKLKPLLNFEPGLFTIATRIPLLRKLYRELGLSGGEAIRKFVRKKIVQKIPDLRTAADISFEDLKVKGARPLKIVVTNLKTRRPETYSAAGGVERNGSVINAVRASTSYPFVFRPAGSSSDYLVDGGLCSNLPIFLFDREREADGLPVIAFDLVSAVDEGTNEYKFGKFCQEMMDTALESGDFLLRQVVSGVHYVPVQVPRTIGTLDFDITPAQSEELFNAGRAAAHSYFAKVVPEWTQASSLVEMLQARFGMANSLVVPVLRAAAREFEEVTGARAVRANVTAPTPHGTRVVVYQFGMDHDPDSDLELRIEAGCSGRAWTSRAPVAADLYAARENFQKEWKMTQEQQNKVPRDRRAMFSFPMFDLTRRTDVGNMESLGMLGTFSVDTTTSLADTGWVGDRKVEALNVGKRWADILSRLLS